MKTLFRLALLTSLSLFLVIAGCKKDSEPNSLGGETNIPLTAIDSVSSVYMEMDGLQVPTAEIKVVSNVDGQITYHATVPMTGIADSLKTQLASVIPAMINYYHPQNLSVQIAPNGDIQADFSIKITSEGIQHSFIEGKPCIVVKYADGVGASYSVTMSNGKKVTSTVTEKTDQNDWPYGFYYIKTSKVETVVPDDDPVIQSLTYRANHKFGLVFIEVKTKNGKTIRVDLFPWFLL